MAKANKTFLPLGSSGYSSATLNQKDAIAFLLKLISNLQSYDNSAHSSSRPERLVFFLQQKDLKPNQNLHTSLSQNTLQNVRIAPPSVMEYQAKLRFC